MMLDNDYRYRYDKQDTNKANTWQWLAIAKSKLT